MSQGKEPQYRVRNDVDLNYWIERRTFYYEPGFFGRGWVPNPWKFHEGNWSGMFGLERAQARLRQL